MVMSQYPELNPAKSVWVKVKIYVVGENIANNLVEINKVLDQKLSDLFHDNWKKFSDHVYKLKKIILNLIGL